jgi:hypothetical protein
MMHGMVIFTQSLTRTIIIENCILCHLALQWWILGGVVESDYVVEWRTQLGCVPKQLRFNGAHKHTSIQPQFNGCRLKFYRFFTIMDHFKGWALGQILHGQQYFSYLTTCAQISSHPQSLMSRVFICLASPNGNRLVLWASILNYVPCTLITSIPCLHNYTSYCSILDLCNIWTTTLHQIHVCNIPPHACFNANFQCTHHNHIHTHNPITHWSNKTLGMKFEKLVTQTCLPTLHMGLSYSDIVMAINTCVTT